MLLDTPSSLIWRRLLGGLAMVMLFAAPSIKAEPLSAELMAKKPEFYGFQLSPSGTHVAYIRVSDDDLLSLMVFDLATGDQRGVAGTQKYDVGGFRWVNDQEIVLNLTEDKLYAVGIYVYDIKRRRLAEIRGFKNTNTGASIVSVPRDRKNRVITSTGGEDGVIEELTTKYDKNSRSFGSNRSPVRRSYAPPSGRLMGYSSDVSGEPVLAVLYEDGKRIGCILDTKDETWTRLPLDLERTPILGVATDHQLAWIVRSTAGGGTALHTYDLIAQEYGPVIYEDPDYDLSDASIYLDPTGRELQGIHYHQARRHTVWFDQDLEDIHAKLKAALQGYDIVLIDRSDDQRKALFVAVNSTEPGQYFFADMDKSTIKHIAASAPWLEGVPLSPTASFNFKSRDGLKLQAYLTLPTGANAQKPFPLMVLGHGGPWARDTWRYDGEVQFLASRGFAVMQPNYRGSTGFSYDVSIKDRYNYRKMHDDVTDAVNKLVRSGMVDEKRLAIMGASFGGYLAGAAAAWEPELYRVAISNVGVFDWEMRISDAGRGSLMVKDLLKSFWAEDPAQARRYSPIHQADDIQIPMMLAHGRRDGNVHISQSVRLERNLKSRRVPVVTYYEGDSGHGFSAAHAQEAYLKEVDKFLTEYFFNGTPDDRNR